MTAYLSCNNRRQPAFQAFKSIRPRLTINFHNLGLTLSDGTTVLSGVTGRQGLTSQCFIWCLVFQSTASFGSQGCLMKSAPDTGSRSEHWLSLPCMQVLSFQGVGRAWPQRRRKVHLPQRTNRQGFTVWQSIRCAAMPVSACA
jgi:hypothetical protein